MNAPPEYLTADQIADELGVNVQAVQRHFREGTLPGRKIGGGWRTPRAVFDQWMLGENPATIPLEGHDNGLPLETKDDAP